MNEAPIAGILRTIRSRATPSQSLFAITFALAACGPERVEEQRICPAATGPDTPEFEHACEHASTGPFEALDATSGHADVRNTHLVYDVSLAPTGEGYRSQLRFVPRVSGRFALFTTSTSPLLVASDAGPLCARSIVEQSSCPELARAESYELVVGEPISLVLGPVAFSRVALLIERE